MRKTTFLTEWGVFVEMVAMFSLNTTPTTFPLIIMDIFSEYTLVFMQVILDDFAVYSRRMEHLDPLRMFLEK